MNALRDHTIMSSVGFKFNFQLQNDVAEVSEPNERISKTKKADTKEQQCENALFL